MDRINIECLIAGQKTQLQLDRKSMPGEPGPCYMLTENGCFKGYIAKERSGSYKALGTPYYTTQDLQAIGEYVRFTV